MSSHSYGPQGRLGGIAPPPPQGPRASFLPLAAAGAPRRKPVQVLGLRWRGLTAISPFRPWSLPLAAPSSTSKLQLSMELRCPDLSSTRLDLELLDGAVLRLALWRSMWLLGGGDSLAGGQTLAGGEKINTGGDRICGLLVFGMEINTMGIDFELYGRRWNGDHWCIAFWRWHRMPR